MTNSTNPYPPNPNQPSQANKVLVIGLDGATFDLIKPWVAEGLLPTLGRLLEEGSHVELRSMVPPMTGPAWTSFATGVNPAKHRIYDWIGRQAESYRFLPLTALDNRAPTLYQRLSQRGRRVCVFNVPMTYPPVAVNGVMISGLPAPSTRRTITYPPTLFQEIIDQIGDYILYPDPGQAYSDAGIDAFLQRLYRSTELRIKTLDYLRRREDWDFAMVVLNGTDTVCHAMWKHMDVHHPQHDPTQAAKYGNAIRDYYRYVDGLLQPLVESLPDDTTMILMSDHGFGPLHKFIHVNNWLLREGFMQVKKTPRALLKQALFRAGFSPMNVYNLLMKFGLGALKREVVRGQGQDLLKTLFFSFEDIDWQQTQAYAQGNVGQIYINLAGREPLGIVQSGAQYDTVRNQIIERLKELRDPQDGAPVVDSIYRREEIYHGPYLEQAADIIFLPKNLEYFGFGEYEFGSHQIIEAVKRGISGTHRMNGVFLAYGKAIAAKAAMQPSTLLDLAPTILHLMGEAIPEQMDGRVLNEILLNPASPLRYEPQSTPESADTPLAADALLSEADQQLLSERLRSLGYVG
ncbi:MAG: alkaline phosphatase family protein [Caldilineaceae bacterium]